MQPSLSVVHYQRRPRETGNYSIEGVFSSVRDVLKSEVSFQVRVASEFSNGLLPRYRIMREAASEPNAIVHVTGDINFAAIQLNPTASVLTCHDFGFLDKFTGIRRQLLQLFWVTLPVRKVTAVTTVSQTSKARLLSIVKGVDQKVTVVHNSVSPLYQFSPKPFNKENPRYLMIGTAPNKNVLRVVEALRGLPGTLRIIGVVDSELQKHCDACGVQMTSTHHISDSDMVAEYYSSDILLFPSTLEGFGIPIVEAQAMGRPVITSNLSSMPEIAGDAACLVDPYDCQSIRTAVKRISEDETYRNLLVEKGRVNVSRFTPDRMAQGYLEVYQKVEQIRKSAGGTR